MCGIVGVVAPGWDRTRRYELCNRAMISLAHRGPDGNGLIEGKTWTLGHQRLAIIDIVGGYQPRSDATGRFSIVFNGEITNHIDLRKVLEGLGHEFSSTSDTEVLLEAYLEWGVDCLKWLNGMYAVAIVDSWTGDLFLGRDPLGIKPLYFSQYDGSIIFASEIRAFYASGDIQFTPAWEHVNEFVIFGSVAGSPTLHAQIDELPGGHWALWSGGRLDIERFWYPVAEDGSRNLIGDSAVSELSVEVERAILEWTVSDVDIGIFLSGGIDSGLVATVASQTVERLSSFTAWIPGYAVPDERIRSRNISETINSTHMDVSCVFDYRNAADILGSVVDSNDAPAHDSNSLTYYLLCETVRQESDIKVILTGDGSDECFAGYARHNEIASRFSRHGDPNIIQLGNNWLTVDRMSLFAETTEVYNSTRENIVTSLRNDNPLHMVLEYDQLCFLPPYLRRMDHIAMEFGIETRPPLLDHRLVELTHLIPSGMLTKLVSDNEFSKYIFRQVSESWLPSEIVWKPEKFQFALPVSRMFDVGGCLHNLVRDILGSNCILSQIYRPQGIQELLRKHYSGQNGCDHSNTLFRLLNLEIWLQAMT